MELIFQLHELCYQCQHSAPFVYVIAVQQYMQLAAVCVPVMFLLNKVISSSESDEMCVVCRSRDGDTTSASHIRVTQLVRQHLNLIGTEVIIIPQHMVV